MQNGRLWISQMARRDSWLNSRIEDIIMPDLPIVDPHHHLWIRNDGSYLFPDFCRDVFSGHNIKKSVYIECGAFYHKKGPEYLHSLGEVEHISEIIQQNKGDSKEKNGFCIDGIVSRVDMTLPNFEQILKAHSEKSGGFLKGVRHSAAFALDSIPYSIPGNGPAGLYLDKNYQRSANLLNEVNLSLDCWHYFSQSEDFSIFLENVTETTIILNHMGMPIGIGSERYKSKLFKDWQYFIEKIATKTNVYLKLGGLAMVDLGWGLHNRSTPIGSEEFAELFKPQILHCIDILGPNRCMFESNFPVDRVSVSYQVLWNAFKIICNGLGENALRALFFNTAKSIYNLS